MTTSAVSRTSALRSVEKFQQYCYYQHSVQSLAKARKTLSGALRTCGLSLDQFLSIESLATNRRVARDEVTQNILRVHEIKKDLDDCASSSGSLETISTDLQTTRAQQRERIAGYLQTIVNKSVLSQWMHGSQRCKPVKIKRVIQKLAKAFGKSKRAYKTFDNLRKDPENFEAILDLIPVWIMELDDASRIIPLQPALFDYVILDEASQCNVAYTSRQCFDPRKPYLSATASK